MRRALAEAERGLGSVEPNPMVGAVVVRNDAMVSVGHHERYGGPHAEVLALGRAGAAARGATLYVTLEPCCHHGKTPPCTDAVLAAGVARVVAATLDPFPEVAGGGLRQLREAGVAIEVGVLREPALRLNAPYFKRLATGRPYVTAKWAMTLDGRLATASGSSRWISGPRSRAAVHELRGRMDGVAVGIGTAMADDPQLTARPAGPRTPTRIVLDTSARLPPGSVLAATARAVPTVVVVTALAPEPRCDRLRDCGCRVLRFEDAGLVPVGPLLQELGRMGMTNLLVEGGGRVLGSFLDAGEVDAVEVFLAPIVEGGRPEYVPFVGVGVATMDLARRLERHDLAVLDGDVHLRGTFPHRWLGLSPT